MEKLANGIILSASIVIVAEGLYQVGTVINTKLKNKKNKKNKKRRSK